MENVLILAVMMAVIVLVTKLFSKDSKDQKPSGNCANCPEYRYCGGGRPRCARRNETLK